ncbi:LRP4 protein, partial [Amia calva]|nr:LRP4 protein [Amia calva]
MTIFHLSWASGQQCLGEWQCDDGTCISKSWRCDGQGDCLDGSDEMDCACEKGEFHCKDGSGCMDASAVCNGKPQCNDGSDKLNCSASQSCLGGEWKCDNRICIPEELLCNGVNDCVDNSDEKNCDFCILHNILNPVCFNLDNFQCTNGSCIEKNLVCDGIKHCPDGIDETNCAPKIKDCTFRCDNGTKCFIRRVQCDGVKDCVDGTDEEKCYMNAGKFRPGAPAIQCQRMSVACWDQLGCVRYDHICDGERDCVDGSDEDDCPRRCTDPDNFECNDGTCIERLLVCDGKPQCADHSDEDRCQKPVMDCVNPCDSGTSCFASSSRCDGRKDCRDGADEDGCHIPVQTVTCPSTSVPCREGSQCITKDQLCNGKRDCPDGFDEDSCPKKCEDPETFLCKDGLKCIKKALVCDGEPQCPDGSDETTCLVTASACRLRCDYNTKCISEAAYCDGKADCRDGADERNCSSPGVSNTNGPLVCGLGFKMCRDGKECILYSHLCDGEEDCKDGSDEDNCSKKCETGFFQCAHGKKCIEEKLVCDDIPHCQDDSDEKNCWKPTEICAFRCDNNTNCFPEKFRCDGDFDCLDHTDEMDCAVEECASSEFQCSSGQCISLSLRCDGDADCRDHSDEKNCSKPPHCPTETRCPGSHECLLEEWICDGDVDCKDGSDEKGCQSTAVECSELQWPCKSKKQCIPEYWRCDGERDCYDDSDEAGCGSLKCPDHQFQCGSGECMKTSLVCNGISNCPDGSDEGGNCTTVHCSSSAQCSQICYSTPRGLKCACEVGFKLAEDGLYCEDINECKEISPSICSHKCVNTKGSFTCQCYPGYLLDPNGRSCKAIGEPFLLASIQYELLQYGLRSSSIDVLFSTGKKLVFSLDYDWLEQKLFWVSLDAETIKWTSLDQKQKGTVVKGIKSDCIAVDWVGRNLYWTDGVAGQILAIRMNTTSTKFRNYTVVLDEDLEQPRALVLQPQRGMMFWSEIGSKPQIERAGMDGSDRKVIITKRISWPISLTLDSLGSRIFWTDEKLKCIGSAKLDGTDIKLLQLRETPSPFSVAVFNDMVYWTDTKRRVIQKANKDTGKNRTVLIKRLGQPFGLKIMHENLQGKFPNPCKSLGCSHICLLGPREQAACRCPIGLLLSEDGVSCVTASETAFLFLLSASAVTQIYLKNMHTSVSQKTWPEHKALSTSNLNVMTALDYVVKDQILYLANADQGFVGQYKVKESELVLRSKVLQLQGDAVTALAVDWLTNNLYWSSSRQALLRVTSATGAYTTVLFADNLEGPSSIALHPPSGNMCFADVGKEGRKSLPQIECAYMDGQNRRVLWRKAVMPTSLTFSDQGTELFWADIDSGVIGSVDMDGLKYKAYQTGGGLLTSFARSDYVFFWTTFNDTTKMWYSDGQQPRQLWFEVKTTVLNLKVYSKFSQNGSGGCATQNGGCSHLCLPFPGGRTCRCAQDYRLSNDTDCVKDLQCPPDTKPCRDGRKCLASAKWCNRRTDCLDHSDEANCEFDLD